MIIKTANKEGIPTGGIDLDDWLDSDGEMQIEVENRYGETVYKFINKQQAIQIIEHLQEQFKI